MLICNIVYLAYIHLHLGRKMNAKIKIIAIQNKRPFLFQHVKYLYKMSLNINSIFFFKYFTGCIKNISFINMLTKVLLYSIYAYFQ